MVEKLKEKVEEIEEVEVDPWTTASDDDIAWGDDEENPTEEVAKYEESRSNREEKQHKEVRKNIGTSLKNVELIPSANYYKYDKHGEITTFMPGRLVDIVINHVDSIVVNQDFYIYKDGYYKQMKDGYVQGLIQDNIDSSIRKWAQIKDVFEQWKTNLNVQYDEPQINTNPFLLNVKNGIINLKTNELQPHSPQILMTKRIEGNFDPDFKIDKTKHFHKFLDQIQPDPEVQAVLQQIFGYCLTELVEAQKFFVFDGVSRSGKSTIISLIESLIAPENISHVSLQNLQGFNLSTLHNKTLNTMADLPTSAIPAESVIKAIIGEDPLDAERKHKDSINFMNKAKLLFSTNGMPKNHSDKGDAFFQRLMIIPFTIQVPEDQRDRTLKYKLKEELDYIFNWALQGVIELIQNNFQFKSSSKIIEKNEQYKAESNTLLQFIEEHCELGEENRVPTKWFLDEYKKFCKEELEVEHMRPQTVRTYLKANCNVEYGDNIKFTDEFGKRVKAFKGIKFK